MNFRAINHTIGMIILVEMGFMAPSLIWCWLDSDRATATAFGGTLLVMGLCAGLFLLVGRRAKGSIFAQEGFVTVAISWIVLSLLGCLPFYFSGAIPHYIDALFEVVSGFTTTGSSILADPAALSRGLLFWRSTTHWLGGMGILVFMLAILPASQGGSLHLMQAESPGPTVSKFTPRLRQTSKILYTIYLALTLLCIAFLLAGGMPVFDSLCTAFGTAGTGGFGIKADSMASYSPYLQWVITVFMALFGVNFSVYYLLLMRQVGAAVKDEEVRLYFGIMIASGALIAWDIRYIIPDLSDRVRHAFFQVSSIMTTTGFSTVDFDAWPPFSKAILLCLMAVGACAGSTGGGFKVIRLAIMLKSLRRAIRHTLRPNSVQLVRVNGKVVADEVIHNVGAYLTAYVVILFGSFVLVSLDEFSLESNISAVFACFNNIGPGFAAAGPMSNFAAFSDLSKLVLSLDMLLGRLEIFPLLALASRHSWSRRL